MLGFMYSTATRRFIGADLFKMIHDIIGKLLGIFGKALGPVEE